MGFDCVICSHREIWAYESKVRNVCIDCYLEHPVIIKTYSYIFWYAYRGITGLFVK